MDDDDGGGVRGMVGYPVGVPVWYMLQLFMNRQHLERLKRFQIEKEDIEAEKKARRNTISELTISEFERSELMRLLEEAEVERIDKKEIHLQHTLPTSVKKLTNGCIPAGTPTQVGGRR